MAELWVVAYFAVGVVVAVLVTRWTRPDNDMDAGGSMLVGFLCWPVIAVIAVIAWLAIALGWLSRKAWR